jgi:hypothetical protein
MSRRETDALKGLFRMRHFFDAVPDAWRRAIALEHPSEWRAVRLLLAAMDAHGRRPAGAEILHFFQGTRGLHGQEKLLAGLACAFAVQRWYLRAPEVQGIAVLVGMEAAMDADGDPVRTVALRLEIFELAMLVAEALPVGPPRADSLRLFRNQLGSALAPDDDPVAAARGRALLREHLGEVRAALSDLPPDSPDRPGLQKELGRALANVGQSLVTWAERHDRGDPVARLEEALVLHDEAMSIPERVADPRDPHALFASLRMRGVCRRHLAAYVDDPQRKILLLEGAAADAAGARELALRHAAGTFPDGDAMVFNLVNARNNLLRARFEAGLVDDAEIEREIEALERLAAEAGRSRHPRAPVLMPAMREGLAQLRRLVRGEDVASSPEEIAQHIRAALGTMQDSRARGIEPAAASSVVARLERLPDVRLPAQVMDLLAGFFGHLDIVAIGPELASRAMRQEFRLLALESGAVRDGWDPVTYAVDGLKTYELALCDWRLAHAERRIAAGWISIFATLRLGWAGSGERPLGATAAACLVDLQGSAAWRSDLGFYGQGPVRYGTIGSEASWRCDLYRTRWDRDHVADWIQGRGLRDLLFAIAGVEPAIDQDEAFGCEIFPVDTPREVIRARTDVPEAQWVETRDGIVVPARMTDDKAGERSIKGFQELDILWRFGVEHGWAPREIPDSPLPTVEDLERWLAANPDAAVLVAGETAPPSVIGGGAGGTWFRSLEPDTDLREALSTYMISRDRHSYGDPEAAQEVLKPGTTSAARDAAYATRIGTPEAATELDQSLSVLLAGLGAYLEPLLVEARSHGVRRLLVLARSWARHIPWFAVPFGHGLLSEHIALALVETLAPVPRHRPKAGPSALYVGGAQRTESPLRLGKALLAPLGRVTMGPASRDEFESLAQTVAVLRVFAHGESIALFPGSSGFHLDEDDRRGVNRYSASESRMLDLRGCRRVELWACESGRADALYSRLLHHDEPGGVDAAVLLAGAECTVTSLWMQYVLPSAMIAEAFTVELAARTQPEGEALGAVVRRYREAMAEGGTFATAVAEHITGRGSAPVSVEAALRVGLEAWRKALWQELLGRDPPPLDPDASPALGHLGPSHRPPAATSAAALLAPFRSPVAWAGWKIVIRSKEVFTPPPTGTT